MKAIEMSRVIDIETSIEYDLGDVPGGLIFEDGEMYDYDNVYLGCLDENKQYKFIDTDDIEDICTYKGLFISWDFDDYEKPESNIIRGIKC